jgi:hypothetical protein
VIDVQHAVDGLRRLVAGLLLRALLLLVPLLLLLLGRTVLLLLGRLPRIGVGRGLVPRSGLSIHRGLRRLLLRLCHVAVGLSLVHAGLPALVVLDVDDAALRVERRGQLVLAVAALAASPAAAPAVAAEAPSSAAALAFLTLALPLPLSELPVPIQPGLWVAGVARLRRIGCGLRGFRRCGRTLSFVHLVRSVTSSAGG